MTRQSRRRVLTALAAVGTAALVRAPRVAAAETLETTTIRLVNNGVICEAPLMAAEELLRAEGFSDIRYVKIPTVDAMHSALTRGDVDFALWFPVFFLPAIEAGASYLVLAGVHIGCFELFAQDGIRGIAGLKGKTVGLQTSPANLLTLMALQVGLDPAKDIRWITSADSKNKPLELFAAGKIDAFLGFPPEPQELRERNIGHVILNTAIDRPWSQYFCCMVVANRDYVGKYPVAAKRVLRAILKADELCATEPERVARDIVERGFTPRYAYALQTLRDVPYKSWRDYDSEDSLRFYALRLHEAGLIKSSPQKIIAKGTDWRFLKELQRELKA